MTRLEGRNVLITGASSGLGKVTDLRMARDGADVAINCRSGPSEAEATQVTVHEACLSSRYHGCRDLIVAVDISKGDQVPICGSLRYRRSM
jgi:glucose 1-dehydrogenase